MKMKTRCFAYMLVLFFGILLSACAGPAPAPTQTPTPEKLSVGITPAAYPQIVRQKPLAGERLGLSPNIEIVFDRPMQPEKTAAAWQFVDADGKAVAGKTTWSDPQTFQFRPDQSLKPGQAYTGVFSVAASGADGSHLPDEIRLAYHATDELAVGQVWIHPALSEVVEQALLKLIRAFNES